MDRCQEIEKSIITRYRKDIWSKFIKGIKEFQMINEGDKIAVCISGGKDSMLLAKCMQELQKHKDVKFELVFLVMNPGYNEENKNKIIENAKLLNIPITMFETNIFAAVERVDDHPCYICARMRRGYLYRKAKELGCNKIALGHHFDDVIETILMGMLYGAQMQTMMPKLRSTFHEGMELIRPLYYVKEEDIIKWKDRNGLEFIQCACKITEKNANNDSGSKRDEIKRLIKQLRSVYDKVDMNIYNSTKNVNLETLISYVKDGETHHFLDDYDRKNYYIYMLRCEDNSIYTGITTNLERRMKEHFSKGKKCAKYTNTHTAKKLECAWKTKNKQLASKLEYHLKTLTKKQKEDIIKDGKLLKNYLGDKIEYKIYKQIVGREDNFVGGIKK